MLNKSGRASVSPFFILKCLCATFIIYSFIATFDKADALWPFGSSEEESYIAKIDDYVITEDYFAYSVRVLHSSSRAGEALSRQSSFAKQSFTKHLNDMIDTKLLVMEAKRFGVDKEAEYLSQMESFRLNFFLRHLRDEEIMDKVTVSDEEVAQYLEEARKEEEAAAKAAGEGDEKSETSEQETDAVVSGEGSEEDVDTSEEEQAQAEAKAHGKKVVTAKDRIYNKKVAIREVEYFESLRAKARVKVYDDALKVIAEEGAELPLSVIDATTVAKVNGKPVSAFEFMLTVSKAGHDFSDEDILREELEALVLRKLLDEAAISKGYEKTVYDLADRITAYSDKKLVSLFKRKIVAPIVKVSDEDVVKFYEDNKDKFVKTDSYNISTITVTSEESAQELLKDLRAGADFVYVAKTMSIDPSNKRGGELGWVDKGSLPPLMADEISEVETGDIVGPFKGQYGYFVVRVNDMKVGDLAPFEEVKDAISVKLGREFFKDTLDEYLLRLRGTVKISINEDSLRRFNEGKR
ncbi:MAG: peptidyl-prolyl cis-trans isomerase [Deltaproteobacteria bacterium]|nr:peptidyl-prolyl cis-trans isomerase [Deltaproteobacteria bacterium]